MNLEVSITTLSEARVARIDEYDVESVVNMGVNMASFRSVSVSVLGSKVLDLVAFMRSRCRRS